MPKYNPAGYNRKMKKGKKKPKLNFNSQMQKANKILYGKK